MAELEKVCADLQSSLRKFKEEWGVEFIRRVKPRTPVRTGALQGGWGFDRKQSDIEIYNTKDYASEVEYGTPNMAPRGMMRATLLEKDQITEVAAVKAGVKK